MAIEIFMPALTPTMAVGALLKWLVRPGDRFTAGQVIVEIEADKSFIEFAALSERGSAFRE